MHSRLGLTPPGSPEAGVDGATSHVPTSETKAIPGLESALREWEAAIGSVCVRRDALALEEASTATFATESRVRAILRPANRDEVQACVRIANRNRVPLYPVSTGKNWG